MKFKRHSTWLALLLVVTLLISMVGCGNSKPTEPQEEPASAVSKTTTEEPKESPAEEPSGDITEITWYISQDATQQDEEAVFEALNAYTEEAIGVRVKQVIYKNPDYNEKVPVMINSGQKFDICFTAAWGNKFLPNVERGAYADITDLLTEYAPETVEAVPDMVWKATTVNDRIYAIPAYKEVGEQPGLMINSDLAEEHDIDLSTIESFADLEPILAEVKEKMPDVIPYANSQFNLLYAYEPLGGDSTLPPAAAVPGFDEFSDQGDKIFNLYETKEFEEYCQMIYRWKLEGYLPDDPVTYDTDNAGRDRDDQAGKLFSWVISYAPGYKDTRASAIGHGVEYIPLRAPKYSGGGGMMAISALSDNKEKALEFLNLVNTDEYVGTLLRHGIEGEHYEPVETTDDAGTKYTQLDPYATGFTAEDHPYNIPFGWQFGNVFNQQWVVSYAPDIAQQFLDYNNGAKVVSHLGFTPDITNVSSEQAALSNVISEYLFPLTKGMADPSTGVEAFKQALRDNGVDTYIEEIQSQLDAWNEQ